MKRVWAWACKLRDAILVPESSVPSLETKANAPRGAGLSGRAIAIVKAEGKKSALSMSSLCNSVAAKLSYVDESTWKERFEAAAKASESIIYEWSPQTRRTVFSAAFSRLTGYAPEEAQDHIAVFPQWLHVDDRPVY